ncbi:MAG: DUF3097 domain-containing protein [Acidothermaceae bacterium]
MNPYDRDVLAAPAKRRAELRIVEAERDLVVEDLTGGFCGAVVECEKDVVRLEDRFGKVRAFPLAPGAFVLDGEQVTLVRPKLVDPRRQGRLVRTASGSVAVPGAAARVARGSRIYVEGRHDAELVERVWGDDLRIEGVVVEYLEGVDKLADIVREFAPTRERRLGVLVDHLVTGSKESRIAASVASANVLVVGHPYVDVWQAVKPQSLGIDAWPAIDRNTSWKSGICAALGWPHHTQADIAAAWRRILTAVNSYADLEPALLGRVEELIDFVTAG